jgi:putative ABC transport system permease protein
MKLFGLRPTTLLGFYGSRLRRHPVQEVFAGAGIAVGVALLFAVQVANTSTTGSAEQVVHGLVGDARLQLSARSADGFPESLAKRTAQLPGVRHAAPLLRARITLVGPQARRSVELVGTTPTLPALGGALTRNFGTSGLRLTDGIALPSGVADATGATADRSVRLLVAGSARRVRVGVVLREDSIGPLAGSQTAVAALPFVQDLTGRRGMVSQVLVVPQRGKTVQVTRELERISGGRLTVAPADAELGLLRQAAKPNDQSTGLFAAIAAMVGFLFALNAMLLTSAERRRFIADLRVQGFDHRQVVVILAFEGLALGTLASLVGLALGDFLSRLVFDEVPEYLAFAFPVGTQRVVHGTSAAFAFGAGLLAALLASLRPLLDLRRQLPVIAVFREAGEPGEGITDRVAAGAVLAGVGLLAVTTAVLVVAPGATLVGGVLLAVAVLLVTPAFFSAAARRVERLGQRTRRANMLVIGMRELAGAKTRSIAVAAVGALAVYGSVAIEGTHADLLRGLDRATTERLGTADLWVTTGSSGLTTDSFPATREIAAIQRAPGIRDVRPYRGSLLDAYGRRMWVIGRPREDREMIPPSQLLEADLAQATRRLRQGGWATISNNLAKSRDLDVGETFVLPTPVGVSRFRVAAITTNIGWVPGTVIINADDYARVWNSRAPAALEVDLEPGISNSEGKRIVQATLGPGSVLKVQTTTEHQAAYRELSRQGLSRLSQISTLLLIAAALAMASAMGTAVWQRRRRLAALKVQGFDHRQLWRALLCETGFVLAIGCGVGAVMGLYGHLLASRYLELTTGYPAPFALGGNQVLVAFALVAGTAYAVAALPGYAAAQVPARVSFQE